MRKIKKIYSFVITILLLIILGIGSMMMMFPDLSASFLGYRIYSILTDSMEPQIPVGSLVFVRTLQKGEEPLQNDVITFEADRFGQPITLTHIYDKSVIENGVTYYRTHAYGVDSYDPYDITYDNIKGVCVYHIPYIGKFMLFIGSPYGFCLLLISAGILSLYQYACVHFDLDEEVELPYSRHLRNHHDQEAILVKGLQYKVDDGLIIVSGELINATSIALCKVKAKLIFVDENDMIVFTKQCYLVQQDILALQEHRKWTQDINCELSIKDVYIEIMNAKKA